MNSLVLELQREIYSSKVSVSDLLRKSYIISRKLNVKDFEHWIKNELNGYEHQKKIPAYRNVVGEATSWNSFRGWVHVLIPNKEMQDLVTVRKIGAPIPELEHLLNNSSDGRVYIVMPDQFSQFLDFPAKVRLEISLSQIQKIVETTKNVLLEWSLKLEEDGILGDDMSFDDNEKQKAANKNYTVNNFYGSVSKNQFQQSSPNSNQNFTETEVKQIKELIQLLKNNSRDLNLSKEEKNTLDVNILSLENEIINSKSIIFFESIKSIRNILEGLTGSLVASGILYKLDQLFPNI